MRLSRADRLVFVWLFIAGILAAILSVPPPPSPRFVLGAVPATALLVASGLFFARRAGFGAPLLEAFAEERKWSPRERRSLSVAAVAGAGLGLVCLMLLWVAVRTGAPLLQRRMEADGAIPLWQRGILALEAGILEELVFRLLILSFFAWMLSRLLRGSVPSAAIFWTANAAAALAFGVVHLPRWFASGPPGIAVVIAVLLINGVVALPLGEIYRRSGIEAAMTAHVTADLVVHGAGPFLLA
jgi:membrane protease YdiL (CAAX protease family)